VGVSYERGFSYSASELLAAIFIMWDRATLEATQGQIDGFFSELIYKCHQNRVASVGD
jgi:hypothetical protein